MTTLRNARHCSSWRASRPRNASPTTASHSWCYGPAIQEASSELQDDYTLSPELSQLWVGEQIRQVSDSLVDRLAEIAVAHGESKSNVARAANASPDNVIRRFPRLKADAAHDRTLIDDVLDSLE